MHFLRLCFQPCYCKLARSVPSNIEYYSYSHQYGVRPEWGYHCLCTGLHGKDFNNESPPRCKPDQPIYHYKTLKSKSKWAILLPYGSLVSYNGMALSEVIMKRIPTKDNSPSSVIQYTKYHKKEKALLVVFNGANGYIYLGVNWSTWRGYLKAESKGQYYNRMVKSQYPCYKVERRTN